jgi:hypothetical protein
VPDDISGSRPDDTRSWFAVIARLQTTGLAQSGICLRALNLAAHRDFSEPPDPAPRNDTEAGPLQYPVMLKDERPQQVT